MKTTMKSLAVLALLAVGACSGLSVRENSLLPALRLAWPGVQADALVAPTAAETVAINAMKDALEAGTQLAVSSVPWDPIEAAAYRGIDSRVKSGEIAELVSGSLRERVRNFAEARRIYVLRR